MLRRANGLFGALALVLALVSLSCANEGGPANRMRAADEVEIGLRRGVAWTTLTLKRNRVMGSTVSLEFRKGQVMGFIDGGAVKLKVTPDEVSGTFSSDGARRSSFEAPRRSGLDGGRVQVDIEEYDGKLEISGTWASERVRLEVSPDNLNGTVFGRVLSQCQYVLDKTLEGGERVGTSICSGMPEPTALIFPKEIERWLTRGEAVTLLLALLASPPPTSTDGMF